MRIVLFASGDFAIPTLRSLTDPSHPDHEIVCVVTQPGRVAGRGRRPRPTPVSVEAEKLGLPVIAPENVNDPEVIRTLRDTRADLGLTIAFGQKVSAPVREVFPHRCVNLHASLLPLYRGAAPFQWAIINGEEETGVTVFDLVDRMDAGPIYVQRRTSIKPDERACELHDRLARIGVDAVNATLSLLGDQPDAKPRPQDDSLATRAPKLKKEDGYLRFDQPAETLANRIHGLWDWPGARCRFVPADSGRAEQVTLALARVANEPPHGSPPSEPPPSQSSGEPQSGLPRPESPPSQSPTDPPGTLDYRRYVATASGYLEILEIKPDNARLMTFQDFVNGRHVKAGDRFEPLS